MNVSELKGRHPGPILVIGGGPSVLADLPRLEHEPVVTLSANEHGCLAGRRVDYIVTGADWHGLSARPMADVLRPFGVPVIGRRRWADYLIDWPLPCNSGLLAVAVGVFLGGAPTIATGIDCYAGGGYFHAPRIRTGGHARNDYPEQLAALAAWVGDADVRPMSGPLTELFPRYGTVH